MVKDRSLNFKPNALKPLLLYSLRTPPPLFIYRALAYPKDFKPIIPKDRFQLRSGPYKSLSLPIGAINAGEVRFIYFDFLVL
jgi:hypothetical protein